MSRARARLERHPVPDLRFVLPGPDRTLIEGTDCTSYPEGLPEIVTRTASTTATHSPMTTGFSGSGTVGERISPTMRRPNRIRPLSRGFGKWPAGVQKPIQRSKD